MRVAPPIFIAISDIARARVIADLDTQREQPNIICPFAGTRCRVYHNMILRLGKLCYGVCAHREVTRSTHEH